MKSAFILGLLAFLVSCASTTKVEQQNLDKPYEYGLGARP